MLLPGWRGGLCFWSGSTCHVCFMAEYCTRWLLLEGLFVWKHKKHHRGWYADCRWLDNNLVLLEGARLGNHSILMMERILDSLDSLDSCYTMFYVVISRILIL